jgi:hypothetical protein
MITSLIRMTLRDFIRNALDRDYSMEQAAADLGALILERDLIKRKGDTDSPRLRELEQLIPLQETLAQQKLRGDEILDRLTQLGIRVENA